MLVPWLSFWNWKNNGKLSKTEAEEKNAIEQTLIYRKFALVAMNNFEYPGLPEEIKPRYIERCLFYNGACCLAKTKEMGYIALPVSFTGDLNLYYEPDKWSVIGHDYFKNYTIENSVLIRNNQFCAPSELDVRWYAMKIADIERTIDVNINLQKLPWIFKGNGRNLLTLKNIFQQVERHEPAIYVDDNMNPKAFDVLATNTPYVIDKLEAYKQQKVAEFYEMYGYPTTQTEKSERLTMTESEVKVEFSDSGYVGQMLEYRRQGMDEFNKMFGEHVEVKINRYRDKSDEYYELEEMKLNQQMGFRNDFNNNQNKKEEEK